MEQETVLYVMYLQYISNVPTQALEQILHKR